MPSEQVGEEPEERPVLELAAAAQQVREVALRDAELFGELGLAAASEALAERRELSGGDDRQHARCRDRLIGGEGRLLARAADYGLSHKSNGTEAR